MKFSQAENYLSKQSIKIGRSLACLIGAIVINIVVIGQVSKPTLDTSVFDRWPRVTLNRACISNDGKYAGYVINVGEKGKEVLVIKQTFGNWEERITGGGNCAFSSDSRRAFYTKGHDSLCLLQLAGHDVDWIVGVNSFKLFGEGAGEWLACRLKGVIGRLLLYNFSTAQKKIIDSVSNYWLLGRSDLLLLQQNGSKDNAQSLRWIRLPDGEGGLVWEGTGLGQVVPSDDGHQLAFVTENVGHEKTLWRAVIGKVQAKPVFSNKTSGIDSDLCLGGISSRGFSRDGRRLFILLTERAYYKSSMGAAKVDVWNYQDVKLQSDQLKEVILKNYFGVANFENGTILRLQQDEDISIDFGDCSDDYAMIMHLPGFYGEGNWNSAGRRSYYLVSTQSGVRKNMKMEGRLSPSSKYVVGIGTEGMDGNIWCYETTTGLIHNLTGSIVGLRDPIYDDAPLSSQKKKFLEFAGWLSDESGILVYDRYDIWRLDPLGHTAPVNLTQGYGRRHHVVLRLAGRYRDIPITEGPLIVNGFNRVNKESGFYRVNSRRPGIPELLTMGPYTYNLVDVPGQPLLKARDTMIYLLLRGSALESLNWYATVDFKTLYPVSSIRPEANWNWLQSELLVWKGVDGHPIQGILYKPENFDPHKKYAVIINYYEKRSDELYKYWLPDATTGNINIPWFVSHGYLVFVPDIFYKQGYPGESAFNAVVSGAKYISRYKWVDSTKIGIQGQSFGGYETNYLITSTNIFAAAMSSSGVCDLVSDYGALDGNGQPRGWTYEIGQYRIGALLWERPDLYLKNSPLFRANKITTPLLMMNNKADGRVPFTQGVEFFWALRRLCKKVWMLQYDDAEHTVRTDKDALQHTIRLMQFFDHYLKNSPAPLWMTQGIPARLKGIETGYAYDPAGNCGKDCKVCKMWNEKMKKDSVACWKEIREKEKSEHWMGDGQ